MTKAIADIVETTREWPEDQRAELVEQLILTGHGGITPAVEAAWRTETRNRVAEIQNGTARGTPVEDVQAEIRRLVGL